jgi:hypothetical protein
MRPDRPGCQHAPLQPRPGSHLPMQIHLRADLVRGGKEMMSWQLSGWAMRWWMMMSGV